MTGVSPEGGSDRRRGRGQAYQRRRCRRDICHKAVPDDFVALGLKTRSSADFCLCVLPSHMAAELRYPPRQKTRSSTRASRLSTKATGCLAEQEKTRSSADFCLCVLPSCRVSGRSLLGETRSSVRYYTQHAAPIANSTQKRKRIQLCALPTATI